MVAEPTALAVRESAPPVIVPRNLAEMIDIAERIAKSQLLPEALRNKVPEVLMQIMAGQELGLYSMASLRSFHIINGKPVMSADAMVAVVLGSGKCEYFRRVEATDEKVTYATKRRGEPEQRCTWTWQMAKDAALSSKETWRCFRRQMLASRAKSELARDVYPDVLAGCYTNDEVRDGDSDMRSQTQAQDAEFIDVPIAPAPPPFAPSDYPEIAEIESAPSVEALKAIAARFSARRLKSGDPAYDSMREAYKLRLGLINARSVSAPVPTSAGGTSDSVAETANGSSQPSGGSTGEVP